MEDEIDAEDEAAQNQLPTGFDRICCIAATESDRECPTPDNRMFESEFTLQQISELEVEGDDSPCAYLPQQTSTMTYRVARTLTAERYESLLERGWRRFGRTLFRPVCRGCQSCQPLRVEIGAFSPSKSQRRCSKRIAARGDFEIDVQMPRVTEEHIQLYDEYHADMNARKGWAWQPMTPEDYHSGFIAGEFPFARQFEYRLNSSLVGVGLVDVTPNVMSSIYFYFSPELRAEGFGTWSILQELCHGSANGQKWLYLGYFIRDCSSMSYKNRFRPCQVLDAFVDDSDSPRWRSMTEMETKKGGGSDLSPA